MSASGSMFNKHKDRLYLVLERKPDLPGYIWSIVLAPADERHNPASSDAIQWHIVEESQYRWVFRKDPLNMTHARRIVARLCVGKFHVDDEDIRAKVDTILRKVPLDQDDATFRSRVWAMEAMDALFHAGIARHDISKAGLEMKATDFANAAMLKLTRRELVIDSPADIPTEDMRW